MEKSTSKFTIKFVIRFIIWFLIFSAISIVGVVILSAVSAENMDSDDVFAAFEFFKGVIIALLVADLAVAFLTTRFATKGSLKKIEVTEENKSAIFKNAVIVLLVFTVIAIGVRVGIKTVITEFVEDDTGLDIAEFEEDYREFDDDLEEFLEEYDEYHFYEDEIEEVEEMLGVWKLVSIYVYDGLFIALMIPVAKSLIDKKVKTV